MKTNEQRSGGGPSAIADDEPAGVDAVARPGDERQTYSQSMRLAKLAGELTSFKVATAAQMTSLELTLGERLVELDQAIDQRFTVLGERTSKLEATAFCAADEIVADGAEVDRRIAAAISAGVRAINCVSLDEARDMILREVMLEVHRKIDNARPHVHSHPELDVRTERLTRDVSAIDSSLQSLSRSIEALKERVSAVVVAFTDRRRSTRWSRLVEAIREAAR